MHDDPIKKTISDLYAKWIRTVGDPDKNLEISKGGNAMAWRMGFFYMARVLVLDVRKICRVRSTETGRNLYSSYDGQFVIEINRNAILN